MNKKGFTLVELLVVITILAVLWTIAFLSLSWYNRDAKNTKVESDLRNIAGALEVVRTRKDVRIVEAVANAGSWNTIAGTLSINDGNAISWSWVIYTVGNMNFKVIEQNGAEFKDPNSFDGQQEYIYAAVTMNWFSRYQLAGQIIENDLKVAQLKWIYSAINPLVDVPSLISSRANDVPLEDREVFTGDLYQ